MTFSDDDLAAWLKRAQSAPEHRSTCRVFDPNKRDCTCEVRSEWLLWKAPDPECCDTCGRVLVEWNDDRTFNLAEKAGTQLALAYYDRDTEELTIWRRPVPSPGTAQCYICNPERVRDVEV